MAHDADSVPAMTDIWTALQSRRRTGAGAPVVTFVDVTRAERTELSATSLENAAAKIANALRDEFDLSPGALVGLHLPAHWQRSAWCAGAWTAGCVVIPDGTEADLVVCAPQSADRLAGLGIDVCVVSLHPFGLPLTEPLPDGAVDVTIAVRQQPDAYLFDPPSTGSPALRISGETLDHAALLAVARSRGTAWGLAPGGRLLADDAVSGADAWLAALAVPLACDASVVLVHGGGAGVAGQERVTASAASG